MLHRPKELIRRPQVTFAACVVAVALLQSVSAISMPVAARRVAPLAVAVSLSILVVHAAVYLFAEPLRARVGLPGYATVQAALLLAFAVITKPGAVMLGLLMLLTIEMLLVGGERWGVVPITAAAVALFVVGELLTGGLYQAASAGVALALTGGITHGVMVLARQRTVVEPAPPLSASSPLSARETEVLRELVGGARNAEIAARLRITERTVKAHLSTIYLKLGVETRAAAVAIAVQRQLV